MAVNGIISGIGDKENNINQILPELDASILAVLLESGVYYTFSDDITVDFDLCKVNVPKFFCIASGFKVYFDTPTELFFTKPASSSDTFYYHVLVEVKTNVVPNTSKLIIIRNDGEDLPEEYYRQDNLIKVKGIFYLEITSFEVELSQSGTHSFSFFNEISKVNAAVKSDVTTRLDGIITRSTTGVTQSKGTANETIATTKFVRDAINFGNDTIELKLPPNSASGASVSGSVNELTRSGGLVAGSLKYQARNALIYWDKISSGFQIGDIPKNFRLSRTGSVKIADVHIVFTLNGSMGSYNSESDAVIYVENQHRLMVRNISPATPSGNQISDITFSQFSFYYTAEDI